MAYLVAAGPEVPATDLREHARRSLPEPMVPAAFVTVPSLPLSPTGKVDRAALAEREVERAGHRNLHTAGRRNRAPVAEIWQEVLGLERVGVEDNFFDLGGHSLGLVQVQRKIRSRFARDISVVDLFRTPTIAALSRFVAVPAAEAGAAASAQAVDAGDERAQRRRALRDRRRGIGEAIPEGAGEEEPEPVSR